MHQGGQKESSWTCLCITGEMFRTQGRNFLWRLSNQSGRGQGGAARYMIGRWPGLRERVWTALSSRQGAYWWVTLSGRGALYKNARGRIETLRRRGEPRGPAARSVPVLGPGFRVEGVKGPVAVQLARLLLQFCRASKCVRQD